MPVFPKGSCYERATALARHGRGAPPLGPRAGAARRGGVLDLVVLLEEAIMNESTLNVGQHRCPQCRAPLVERTNRASGETFLGCTTWSDCTYSTPIPADVLMRRVGAMTLPGMEAL